MTDVRVRARIVVVTRGDVSATEAQHVRDWVASALPGGLAGPLTRVRIKLTVLEGVAHPALAEARLEVGWRVVRATVAAPTIAQAGRWVATRLATQWQAAIDGRPRIWPDPAGHLRPRSVPRPVQDRALLRRKAYRLVRCAPGPAGLRMDALDYIAHLFTDVDTGQDAVIYRAGPTGYRLARQHSNVPPARLGVLPLTVDGHPAPVLATGAAMDRLGGTDAEWLFFADRARGRGRLLYRRVDGHYGLVEPPP